VEAKQAVRALLDRLPETAASRMCCTTVCLQASSAVRSAALAVSFPMRKVESAWSEMAARAGTCLD